jgi:outer membrane lipoprotein SlyB
MKDRTTEMNPETKVPPEKVVPEKVDAVKYGIEPTNPDDVVIGAEIGGVGGAVTGAIAGSALGAAGAVTGAVIGGVLGAAGSAAAVAVVDKVDDDVSPKDLDVKPIDYQAAADYYEKDERIGETTTSVPILPDDKRELVTPPDRPVELRPDSNRITPPYTDPEDAEMSRRKRPK